MEILVFISLVPAAIAFICCCGLIIVSVVPFIYDEIKFIVDKIKLMRSGKITRFHEKSWFEENNVRCAEDVYPDEV